MSAKQHKQNEDLKPSPKQRYQKDFTILPKTYEQARGGVNLSSYESRVLAGIESQDFGYPKKRKPVSTRWLEIYTGLSRGNVRKAIDGLLQKKIIYKAGQIKPENGTKPAFVYEIERDFSKWMDAKQTRGGRVKANKSGWEQQRERLYIESISDNKLEQEKDSKKIQRKTLNRYDRRHLNRCTLSKQVIKKVEDASAPGSLCDDPTLTQDSIDSDQPNAEEVDSPIPPVAPPPPSPTREERFDAWLATVEILTLGLTKIGPDDRAALAAEFMFRGWTFQEALDKWLNELKGGDYDIKALFSGFFSESVYDEVSSGQQEETGSAET